MSKIFYEAEDFELVSHGDHSYGRFMVESVEPYQLDIVEELKKDNNIPYDTMMRLLKEGIISRYKPDYTVTVNLFDEVEIVKNR